MAISIKNIFGSKKYLNELDKSLAVQTANVDREFGDVKLQEIAERANTTAKDIIQDLKYSKTSKEFERYLDADTGIYNKKPEGILEVNGVELRKDLHSVTELAQALESGVIDVKGHIKEKEEKEAEIRQQKEVAREIQKETEQQAQAAKYERDLKEYERQYEESKLRLKKLQEEKEKLEEEAKKLKEQEKLKKEELETKKKELEKLKEEGEELRAKLNKSKSKEEEENIKKQLDHNSKSKNVVNNDIINIRQDLDNIYGYQQDNKTKASENAKNTEEEREYKRAMEEKIKRLREKKLGKAEESDKDKTKKEEATFNLDKDIIVGFKGISGGVSMESPTKPSIVTSSNITTEVIELKNQQTASLTA